MAPGDSRSCSLSRTFKPSLCNSLCVKCIGNIDRCGPDQLGIGIKTQCRSCRYRGRRNLRWSIPQWNIRDTSSLALKEFLHQLETLILSAPSKDESVFHASWVVSENLKISRIDPIKRCLTWQRTRERDSHARNVGPS